MNIADESFFVMSQLCIRPGSVRNETLSGPLAFTAFPHTVTNNERRKVHSDRKLAQCAKAPATSPNSLSTIPRIYMEERIGSHKLCPDFHVHVSMYVLPHMRTYTQNKYNKISF